MTDSFDDDPLLGRARVESAPGRSPSVAASTVAAPVRSSGRARSIAWSVATIRAADEAMTFDDFAPHEDDPWGGVDHWVEPVEERAGRSSASIRGSLRIGAVGLVGVLMIPLALALREDADDGVRSETLADVDSTVATPALADPATTVVTVPITAAATAPVTAATPPLPRRRRRRAAHRRPAVSRSEPECAGTYTVIANDFWNRFPKTSGASVEEWLAANNATRDTPLYVGDELCIPPGAQAPAAATAADHEPPADDRSRRRRRRPATDAGAPTTAAPVVTPPPATAAAVPAAPPPPRARADAAARSTRRRAEAIIREVWPDELEERALTIARRESSLRPEVYNNTAATGCSNPLRASTATSWPRSASRRRETCSTPGRTSRRRTPVPAVRLVARGGPPTRLWLTAQRWQRVPIAGGRPVDSPLAPTALVAQWIEHLTTDQKVGGSTPSERGQKRPGQ